jgi:hypothetical protein
MQRLNWTERNLLLLFMNKGKRKQSESLALHCDQSASVVKQQR